MLLRLVLFAMLAVGVVAVGALSWTLLAPAPAAAPPHPVRVAVLTAAGPLNTGSLIKPQDLQATDMAPAEVPAGASTDAPAARASLVGAMIRHSLAQGQPVLPGDVVRPGDHGFLAAVLGPGLRAVTVAVDAVSGTAGLIWPGDRVDVILTQTLDDAAAGPGHHIAAQTVLSNTRVIAIDQQLGRGQAPDGASVPANRTATLEVTAAQVERVLVAVKLGHLSLSVVSAERSPTDPTTALSNGSQPRGSVTWESDVSPAVAPAASAAPPVMVHVFQGDAEGREFHF